MRQISKRQFDAYCYARNPYVAITSEEIDWYETGERKILAAIVRDKIDNDFGFVILGRDAVNLFRCIHVSKEFKDSPRELMDNLEAMMSKYANDGEACYPQGDEKFLPNDIYKMIVQPSRVHPYFRVLMEEHRFEAARNIIQEAIYSFTDVDGNYIQQFQSDGFDSRLWELYLYFYFYNSGFEIARDHPAPDFCLSRFEYKCFVEAMTVGSNPAFDVPPPQNGGEIIELSRDYAPIKFGSALYSKLSREKKYWEMGHVQDSPLIFAIHDYHGAAVGKMPGSMTWTRAGLVNYLYGLKPTSELVERIRAGEHIEDESMYMESADEHSFKGKTIPSYFFSLPESENISAVLFSNAATITTFNRMGKLAGLGSKNIKMIRRGMKYASTEGGLVPAPFQTDIDDSDYEESWADSLVMFHNPNAKIPVDPDAFPDISHYCYFRDTKLQQALISPTEVLTSQTLVIVPEKG